MVDWTIYENDDEQASIKDVATQANLRADLAPRPAPCLLGVRSVEVSSGVSSWVAEIQDAIDQTIAKLTVACGSSRSRLGAGPGTRPRLPSRAFLPDSGGDDYGF
eukprot:9475489-Pyramimonas_sp.AAC.1